LVAAGAAGAEVGGAAGGWVGSGVAAGAQAATIVVRIVAKATNTINFFIFSSSENRVLPYRFFPNEGTDHRRSQKKVCQPHLLSEI
jgi:hypothetical protein